MPRPLPRGYEEQMNAQPDPRRINFFEVDTATGVRTFELWRGDITRLPFPVDLLAISAFEGDYAKTPTSVIGALARCGVDVAELATKPAYDFRTSPLACWVSTALAGPTLAPEGAGAASPRFGRVLCVESLKHAPAQVERAVTSVFTVHATLEGEGVAVRTLALPLLGAGDQGIDPDVVISALTDAAKTQLHRSLGLLRVVFVVYDERQATRLSDALEQKLQRVQLRVGASERGIRDDVLTKLAAMGRGPEPSSVSGPILADLKRLLEWPDARSFELGIAGRKLAEAICVRQLTLPRPKGRGDLLSMIEALAELHVAEWIRSYLHTMRVFGNHSAHEKHSDDRVPRDLEEPDLVIWLHCLRRLLDFWEETPRRADAE